MWTLWVSSFLKGSRWKVARCIFKASRQLLRYQSKAYNWGMGRMKGQLGTNSIYNMKWLHNNPFAWNWIVINVVKPCVICISMLLILMSFFCCHVFTSLLAEDEFWIANCVYIAFYKKMQICHLMFATCQKAPFPLGNISLIPSHIKTIANN